MSIPNSEKPHFFVNHCWAIHKFTLAFNFVMLSIYLKRYLESTSPIGVSYNFNILTAVLLFLWFLSNSLISLIGTFTSLLALNNLTHAKSDRDKECLVSSLLSILGMTIAIYIFTEFVYQRRFKEIGSDITQGYSLAFFIITSYIAVVFYRKRVI